MDPFVAMVSHAVLYNYIMGYYMFYSITDTFQKLPGLLHSINTTFGPTCCSQDYPDGGGERKREGEGEPSAVTDTG